MGENGFDTLAARINGLLPRFRLDVGEQQDQPGLGNVLIIPRFLRQLHGLPGIFDGKVRLVLGQDNIGQLLVCIPQAPAVFQLLVDGDGIENEYFGPFQFVGVHVFEGQVPAGFRQIFPVVQLPVEADGVFPVVVNGIDRERNVPGMPLHQ